MSVRPLITGIERVAGELLDVVLVEGADHDPVDVAREHGRGVLQRLAAAELQVAGGEVERVPAELRHPDLERDAGARRGLLEDHRERAAGEEVVLLAALLALLELVGEVEHGLELVAAPVGDAGEAAALEALGGGAHASADLTGTSLRARPGRAGRAGARGR